MEKIGLNQLRTMFLEFYREKEHYVRKSYSLVPEKDKSLLIINSGMAPLKPYFAGIETPPAPRMATCQKCIRTGDIDNVGYTARHGTFFEMLGSFSFGDYFKKESLSWGWEFMTQVLKLPEERLWASIYEEDEEAYDIWRNVIRMPEERIVRLGKDDNFWQIGIGPCGPCSEVYYDRGEEFGCGKPDCKPGCECDRYVEFWNHVFTQFNADTENNYTPLAHKNIDTGLGLERLACIMQETDSIFAVDTIRHILKKVEKVSGVAYEGGAAKTDVSIRIITDHIRSITFMIGDGILPSNEGRGYVLRRLLRRAARHGKLLGVEGTFLANLSENVIEVSGDAYPEIRERKEYIHRILSIEEEKFSNTIDQGMSLLREHMEEMKRAGETVLSGDKVFRLYDTFGFPYELTEEILAEEGCSADEEGFRRNMEHQKETARSARKSDMDQGWADEAALFAAQGKTEFIGYQTLQGEAVVKGIFWDKKPLDSLKEGDVARIVLDRTPFYAEGGGQASDTGMVYNDSFSAEVQSVVRFQDVFAHKICVISGALQPGDRLHAMVSAVRRNETARNHTATHLLQKALRQVLGDHVEQAGSSVTEESLRFDFTHFEAVSRAQLAEIENIVNEKICQFLPVEAREMPLEEALKTGAMSLFGEKYGDTVRVVSVGDFSCELCGGTHLSNSGQAGAFKILSESSVAAGVRRIEAITGSGVYKRLNESERILSEAAETLKTNTDGLAAKVASLAEEVKGCRKELEEFRRSALDTVIGKSLEDAVTINGVKLVRRHLKEDYDVNDLRILCDKIKEVSPSTVIVLALEGEGKVTFIVAVTDDLLDKGYHAGNLIKKIAAAAGGGGGGKADMAQAGAKDVSRIKDALDTAATLL
ncbi:MAG: alanine--tRNA ligase [Bacillota bacterium]|nr:alanine--tRNA ligase [Bacillota bacterium]